VYSFGDATINKKNKTALVAIEVIASRIVVLRGQRVMLDADLAALYGATTKRFNEQVGRNLERFPSDFMFQLTNQEVAILRSQFATSSSDARRLAWGGRRYTPHAFTEHGALMAAMVLNSPRATEVSVYVVRAFVELRDTLVAHKELAKRLEELESRLERKLTTHDQAIAGILDTIRRLMAPPEPTKKRRIGFVQND
jgi:ORF6N domain